MKSPASAEQKAVIVRALAVCPTDLASPRHHETVASLQVTSRCDCGCDSVNFEGWSIDPPAVILADGVGFAPDGSEVGVIVFGTEGAITGLEVYASKDSPARLPEVETIRGYDRSAPSQGI